MPSAEHGTPHRPPRANCDRDGLLHASHSCSVKEGPVHIQLFLNIHLNVLLLHPHFNLLLRSRLLLPPVNLLMYSLFHLIACCVASDQYCKKLKIDIQS